MAEHVPAHAQMELEVQMAEPMNTPIVSSSQLIGKYNCNDLGNNGICISIITKHLYLYNFLGFCK